MSGCRQQGSPAKSAVAEEEWGVYVLRCADDTLYTGATNNVEARLARHQTGKGARYTRSRLPVVLVYWEKVGGRSQALKREAAIKRLNRQAKLRLLQSAMPRDTRQT